MPQPKDPLKAKEWRKKISNTLLGRRCCMRTEFARGHTPWNKGTKGLTGRNKTTFKKGNVPANFMGGYKLTKDGIYVLIKRGHYKYGNLKVGKYESLARHKYREAYGDFDKNMVVVHKDGDLYNNEIDNLELISRKENLRRNGRIREVTCIICKKKFTTKATNCKTCSKKCSKENLIRIAREYHRNYRRENIEKSRMWNRNSKLKRKMLSLISETSNPKDLNTTTTTII